MHCRLATPLFIGLVTIGLSAAGCSTPAQRPALGAGPDADFLSDAARSSVCEIELSRTALTRSEDPRVKEFAQMMINDHNEMKLEVQKFATAQGIVLADRPNEDEQLKAKQISTLSGKEFDREYAARMVDDHQKAVDLFRDQAKAATHPEVRQLAIKTLPELEDHMQRARELKSLVGGE